MLGSVKPNALFKWQRFSLLNFLEDTKYLLAESTNTKVTSGRNDEGQIGGFFCFEEA